MSQAREIRGKIASIKNTEKITRAMELVAASKMRKAKERMMASHPYAKKIRRVIHHVAASHSEYQHPYLKSREKIQRVGYIVVTTDRGLCGGLNINLLRKTLQQIKVWEKKEVYVNLFLIGKKGQVFFERTGGNILAMKNHLGDAPEIQSLMSIIKVMLDQYDQGDLDTIFTVSNEFVSNMKQQAEIRQLLPLQDEKQVTQKKFWDYIYEPDCSRELLDSLLVRYVESQVYQAVVENIACEQAARMIAMRSATDNAGELIKDLQLIYNKARQASITQEISEIVGGAVAIE